MIWWAWKPIGLRWQSRRCSPGKQRGRANLMYPEWKQGWRKNMFTERVKWLENNDKVAVSVVWSREFWLIQKNALRKFWSVMETSARKAAATSGCSEGCGWNRKNTAPPPPVPPVLALLLCLLPGCSILSIHPCPNHLCTSSILIRGSALCLWLLFCTPPPPSFLL